MKATKVIQNLTELVKEIGDVDVKMLFKGKILSTKELRSVLRGNCPGCSDVIVLSEHAAPIVSSNGQNNAERVDEGAAIQEYNSWRDNKEAYLNKEHPEWMEQQYGKMCQKCGFRHFPRPECPGEA